jgi:hypothetical protein
VPSKGDETVRPDEAEEMDEMGEKIASLQCRLARAQKDRDAAKVSVTALAEALAGLVECWDEDTHTAYARAHAALDACGWVRP